MSTHLFDHIDLRVSTLAASRPFYDVFMRALGFTETRVGENWISYVIAGDPQSAPFVCLDEKAGHRGDASRIAFWADTEEEVNRLGEIVRAAGAQVVEGPEYCHEYSPGYYACFFEDRDGNKWEICCRNARTR